MVKKLETIKTKYSLKENFFERFQFGIKFLLYNIKVFGFRIKFEEVKLSNFSRSIQTLDDVKELYLVTCYFTRLKDPQHGIVRNIPDIKYIKPWYDSVLNREINGLIVHDGISEEFIRKYTTDKIKFVKYEPGKYSIFEERWMAYYLILKNNPQIKQAFFTDGNDVSVNFNPFDRHRDDGVLYVGRDQVNRVGDSGWVIDEMNEFLKESRYELSSMIVHQTLFNAGLVGGERKVLLAIMSKIIELTLMTESDYHKDMSLLNIAIFELFKPKLNLHYYQKKLVDPNDDFAKNLKGIVSGYPFNSPFKSFEENSEATFTHK